MRLFLHDFTAYAYPVQLARALARRGHQVTFAYCPSNPFNPGGVKPSADDPAGLRLLPIALDAPLEKFSFARRFQQENEFGRKVARALVADKPDAVLSSNAPLDVQRRLVRAARQVDARFVFWLQDIIGIATHRILRRRLPVVGELVGRYYMALEARLLRQSDAVVMITEDFRPILRAWGVDDGRMETIENWAPLEELPLAPRSNAWSRRQGAAGTFNFVYAGTMGMKHNPALVFELARHFRSRPGVQVLVLTQGAGADWLAARIADEGLTNLRLLPFEPFENMPDVLAAADVLVAVLEPDAGVFSVPSKVLAYLCGGKPVLLAVPPENLIARIVGREGAGVVVAPDDVAGFVAGAEMLYAHPEKAAQMGAAARRYAEQTFGIAGIADRFERVLE